MSVSTDKVAAGGMLFCLFMAPATGGASLLGIPALAVARTVRTVRDSYENDNQPIGGSSDMYNLVPTRHSPMASLLEETLPVVVRGPLSTLAARSPDLAFEVLLKKICADVDVATAQIHADANVGALNSDVAVIHASRGWGTSVRTTTSRGLFSTSTTTEIRPIR